MKDKLRREREEQRMKEAEEENGELEDDWKELRRERKRAKLGKGKNDDEERKDEEIVEFDL